MNDEFSVEYQKHFVNFCLRDSSFLAVVHDNLSHDLFSDQTLQRIVRLVLDFYRQHKESPDTLLFHHLDDLKAKGLLSTDNHTAISTLADELYSYPLQNRNYILSTFVKFVRNQKFKSSLPSVVEYVKKGEFDKAEEKMKEVFSFGVKEKKPQGEFFSIDPSDRIQRRKTQELRALWTLIPPIDQRIGPIHEGELMVLQSQRSSAGKTVGLVQLTRNYLFQGKKVFVAVLEGSTDSWLGRLDQCIAGVTKNELEDYTKLTSKLVKLARTGSQLYVANFPMNLTKVSDIKSYIKDLERTSGFSPEVLVVDYADLLAPETNSKKEDLYAKGEEVYSELVGWMQQDNLFGITAAQSGRGAMDDVRADQVHMSQSIAKVQIAHVILTLNATERETAENKLRIFVAKNREGQAKTQFILDTDFARQQLWVRKFDD